MLEDDSYLGDEYDIQDKRLKQFYNHLDQLNSKNVSAFQQIKRYKIQQENLNKSEITNSVQYKL